MKLIERKLEQKKVFLRRYGTRPNFRQDTFRKNGKDGEPDEVKKEIEACEQLIQEYERLKRSIDYTNLMTTAEVNGKKYSLHNLMLQKRDLCRLRKEVWLVLVSQDATLSAKSGTPMSIVYNFDLHEREAKIAEIDEFENSIDKSLQVANTKIELLSPPPPQ